MVLKIGDKVIIKKDIENFGDTESNDCLIDPKYFGTKGVIVEINEDRPSPIAVKVDMVGTDSFWEEELELDK